MKFSSPFLLFAMTNAMMNSAVRAATDFNYEFTIDPNKLQASNSIITFTEDSKGSIEFCARVETVVDDLNNEEVIVSFKETNFNVSFDLSNTTFSGLTTDIVAETVDTVDEQVDGIITVSACLCTNSTYSCTPAGNITAAAQNTFINVCLKASATSTNITNFSLELTNPQVPDFSYDPVKFGTDGWQHDTLTEVTTGVDGDDSFGVVRSKLWLVAGLFDAGNTVNISGNAFLTFKDTGLGRMMEFYGYEMDIPIVETKSDEDCAGFLGQLMKLLI